MNIDISNAMLVSDYSDLGINFKSFNSLIDKIRITFSQLHIPFDDKTIYYQRNANKTSILAIKLANGDDFDDALYMFNGCDASSFKHYSSCDVYLHADKRVAQSVSKMANLMSRDIVAFFEDFERELLEKNRDDIEFSLRLPIYEQDKKKESVPKKLAKILNVLKKKEK